MFLSFFADESLVPDAKSSSLYSPSSPGRGSDAELQSPGRPQSARISPMHATAPRSTIPEEMYNLLQLAEVSLAASGTTEVRSVLERLRSLKTPAAKALDMSVKETAAALDKPLDLSRDPSGEVRILTPSPSPTPSETVLVLSPKKGAQSASEESGEDEDSCWTPSTSPCCKTSKASKTSGATNDGHECPDCGKRYSTSSNLARHRQTHRSPADQKVSDSRCAIKRINFIMRLPRQDGVLTATKFTCRFPLSRCTSGRTARDASVRTAARRSRVRGSSRATSARTQVHSEKRDGQFDP